MSPAEILSEASIIKMLDTAIALVPPELRNSFVDAIDAGATLAKVGNTVPGQAITKIIADWFNDHDLVLPNGPYFSN